MAAGKDADATDDTDDAAVDPDDADAVARAAAKAEARLEASKIRREAAAARAIDLESRLKSLQEATRAQKLSALVGVSAAEEGGAAVASTARETLGRLVLAEAMHKAVDAALN